MPYIRRRVLRRRLGLLAVLAALVFVGLNVVYVLLPNDSPARLSIRFNAGRLWRSLSGAAADSDAWLRRPARYPADMRADVGYLIKTGYGTRQRVSAQIEAFARAGDFLGHEGRDFVVVGDWTAANASEAAALGVDVHDAIKAVMETKAGKGRPDAPRFLKYRNLQEAVDSGDEERAAYIGKRIGWELDALKFIMGMELMYEHMPSKKWYVILDDDTFLIRPSLELLLGRLDPAKPQYIGNAVGDYKGRFAHGGSAVLLSGEAMRRLFARPDLVAQAYEASLDETWGDRLVALTLLKLGIYLDERYSHHFNGESPQQSRVTADHFCSPVVSFHGMRQPSAMADVGRALALARGPVRWGDLWGMFASQPLGDVAREPVWQRKDYVGRPDEAARTWTGVEHADECRLRCLRKGSGCMAWTHVASRQTCVASPWMVVGLDTVERRTSGLNWALLESTMKRCP